MEEVGQERGVVADAALAAHLREQHVAVHYLPHPGLVHSFWTLDAIWPAPGAAGEALMERLAGHLPRPATGQRSAPVGPDDPSAAPGTIRG